MAIAAAGRSADRDEDRVSGLHRCREIGRELQALRRKVRGDQFAKSGLENWNLAKLERVDLALVLVNADDLMAKIREASSAHKANIA